MGQALHPQVDPVLIRLEGLIILPAVIDTVRNAPLCVFALSEVESLFKVSPSAYQRFLHVGLYIFQACTLVLIAAWCRLAD